MRNKPRIRFKGFTEDWEQRKLGDIATITGGGTPSTNISEYWNGDIDWYSPVEIGEKRYASGSIRKITKLGLEKSSAKILPVGTVLFTSRAGIGNTAILQVEGCTNQGFQSITPNSKELDTYFLYTMTPKLKRYGEVTGAGSTFVEVSGKQMEQMNLMIPSLDEQKHVSQLFKVMDDAITLHQHKLEKLKLAKKALLQKLFPKNGSQFPKIRFKGFTDAWEQRKLDSLGKIITGNTPSTSKKEYWSPNSDGVVWITPTDINSVKTQCSERLLTKDGASQARIVPANSILVTCIASIGKNTINTVEAAFNQQINALVPHFSNSYFILTMLNNMESAFKRVAGTSATSIINKKEFGQLSALLPEIEEQNKIGRIFELIDNNITLHQRKLERLQEVKKGLLQKMFV